MQSYNEQPPSPQANSCGSAPPLRKVISKVRRLALREAIIAEYLSFVFEAQCEHCLLYCLWVCAKKKSCAKFLNLLISCKMWQRNYFTIDNLLNNDKRCHNLKPESNQRDYPQCVPNVELFNHVLATAAKAVNTIDNPYHLPQPCNTSASDMSMFPFWLFFPQYLSMQRSLNMWSPPRSPDSSGESSAGNFKIKANNFCNIWQ